MAAFLPCEPEPGGHEDALKGAPVDGRETRHGRRSGPDGRRSVLDADPRGAPPLRAVRSIARFFENFGKRSVTFGGPQEQPHSFIQRRPGGGRRRTRTGDVQRHCVCDVLVPLTPSLNREFDLHGHTLCESARNRNTPVFVRFPGVGKERRTPTTTRFGARQQV